MVRSTSILYIPWAVSLLVTSRLAAEDWPRFRGVNGSGVSSSTGLPDEFGPEKNVTWSAEVKAGTSSPVIVGGRLFVTSFEGEDRIVQCLDAHTGQELWRQSVKKVRDENMSAPNGPATCTPAADDEHVIVFFPDTALLCYSVSGELRWRVEVGPFHSMHGIANSPILSGDKVLLLADQIQGSYIAAYEVSSGTQLWKTDRVNGVTGGYSTPSVMTRSDGRQLILASGPQGLFAYQATNGELAFSVPGVANAPVTVPVVSDSTVYLCEPRGEIDPMGRYAEGLDKNMDGKLSLEEVKHSVAFYRMLEGMDQRWGNGDGVVEEGEWNAAFGTMLDKGGLVAVTFSGSEAAQEPVTHEPHVKWSYQKSVPYVASPVCYDGILYLIRDQGVFMAIQSADGEVLKVGRLKKGGAQFYASPVAADGKIFVVDTAGRFTVLKAGADWEELSATEFGDDVIATPAICDGRIYVRTNSKLFCFSLSDPPSPAPSAEESGENGTRQD
ncbi:MAG: outer membrane protein assembly factor BamB family protein [Pirellulaceae bacterium]